MIRRPDGSVLISLRHPHSHQGGRWEFPGGKIRSGERQVDALARELSEELGIEISGAIPLISIRHRYPDKLVDLEVFEVLRWRGDPHGREGQQVRWIAPEKLNGFDFPAADWPILTALALPHLALVTPALSEPEPVFLGRLEACLHAGVELVQLRPQIAERRVVRRLASAALELCRAFGADLMINGNASDVLATGARGLHLSAQRMRQLSERPIAANYLFSTSCHNRVELEHAQRLGVDFVYLSPVHATASHPGAEVLGWHRVRALVREARVPVFALGGMVGADTRLARRAGCQGVAILSSLWGAREPDTVVQASATAHSASAYAISDKGRQSND